MIKVLGKVKKVGFFVRFLIYSRFHVYEVHPDCSSIAVGTRQCRVPTSVVYLTNLKSAVCQVPSPNTRNAYRCGCLR